MNLKYQQQKGLIYIFLGRREKKRSIDDKPSPLLLTHAIEEDVVLQTT